MSGGHGRFLEGCRSCLAGALYNFLRQLASIIILEHSKKPSQWFQTGCTNPGELDVVERPGGLPCGAAWRTTAWRMTTWRRLEYPGAVPGRAGLCHHMPHDG